MGIIMTFVANRYNNAGAASTPVTDKGILSLRRRKNQDG
jgi:hypothetical protein